MNRMPSPDGRSFRRQSSSFLSFGKRKLSADGKSDEKKSTTTTKTEKKSNEKSVEDPAKLLDNEDSIEANEAESKTDPLNEVDIDGETPLTRAIRQRAVALAVVRDEPCDDANIYMVEVEKLLNPQLTPTLDPNIKNSDGNAALSVAVVQGGPEREKIVKLLLNHPKIDTEQAGKGGVTPFFSALQMGNGHVVAEFLAMFSIKSSRENSLASRSSMTGGAPGEEPQRRGRSMSIPSFALAKATMTKKTRTNAKTILSETGRYQVTDTHVAQSCRRLNEALERNESQKSAKKSVRDVLGPAFRELVKEFLKIDSSNGSGTASANTKSHSSLNSKSITKSNAKSSPNSKSKDSSNASARVIHYFTRQLLNRVAFACADGSSKVEKPHELLGGIFRLRWGDYYAAKDVYLPHGCGFFSRVVSLASFHRGYSDSTVLHEAVSRSSAKNCTNTAMFKALLSYSAANHLANDGAADDFIQNSAYAMLKARDKNGCTPLHIAAEFLKPTALQQFLQAIRRTWEREAADLHTMVQVEEGVFGTACTAPLKSSPKGSPVESEGGRSRANSLRSEKPTVIIPDDIINAQDNLGRTAFLCCLTAVSSYSKVAGDTSSSLTSLSNAEIFLEVMGKETRRSLPLYKSPHLSAYFYQQVRSKTVKNSTVSKNLVTALAPVSTADLESKIISVVNGEMEEEDFGNEKNRTFDCFYDLVHELKESSGAFQLVAKECESKKLWTIAIKPLVEMCGKQTCVGNRKELLTRLLSQTKGQSRDFYRKEFEVVVNASFEILKRQFAALQSELGDLADEKIHATDEDSAAHFGVKGSKSGRDDYEDTAKSIRSACLELLDGTPAEQYFPIVLEKERNPLATGLKRQNSIFARRKIGARSSSIVGSVKGSKNSKSGTTAKDSDKNPEAPPPIQRLTNFSRECLNLQPPEFPAVVDTTEVMASKDAAATTTTDEKRSDQRKPDDKSPDGVVSNFISDLRPKLAPCPELSDLQSFKLLCTEPLKLTGSQPCQEQLIALYRNWQLDRTFVSEGPRASLYAAISCHVGELLDKPFSDKIKSVLCGSPDDKEDSILSERQFQRAPVKKIARIAAKGREYMDENPNDSAETRIFCGVQYVLDIFRCSLTIESVPQMIACLKRLKTMTLERDGAQCYRVKNMHSRKLSQESTQGGYRDVKVNMLFQSKVMVGADKVELRMIGEVILIFKDFLGVKKHMHLLYKCQRGDF